MKSILFFSLLLFHLHVCRGNNIQVTNISLTGQNTDEDYTMVEFDISWENSWRVIGGPNNWDAAWIFIKYRIGTGGLWKHAWLNDSEHSYCAGTIISTGLLEPALPFDGMTNPGLGVFLYRAEPGSGTFNCQNVQLRWNYGANGLTDNEQVDIKVFAIEHVYVPEGAFYVGSGGNESGAFYTWPDTSLPYQIISEDEIQVGPITGSLHYLNTSGFSGDGLGPIPAAFPKGYKAFYVMKYEISQQGYTDLLNTSTRIEQSTSVWTNISIGGDNPNQFIMSSSQNMIFRNGIWTHYVLPYPPGPVKFYCNQNENTLGNELNDGQNVACNFLASGQMIKYLDWAGLRFMTELEFEKAARGTVLPVPNEFSWGTNYGFQSATIFNTGLPNESTDSFANLCSASGPIRCGAFSGNNSDREVAGSSYYGIMELSGNIWERCVSVGNPQQRNFSGNHGDGVIHENGYAWSLFPGFRGGHFGDPLNSTLYLISDRTYTTNAGLPIEQIGGRGVRTAPE